jgi:Zn-dependent peptidase ImmA (M78 family)
MPRLNPDVLRWARETAGLSIEQAAERLELRPARGASAEERLGQLEQGAAEPSRALLRRMSRVYRRPLIAFYLPAPPPLGRRGEDFRTLPSDYQPDEQALVDALIRDVTARQDLVRDVLEEEEVPLLEWIGAYRIEQGSQYLTAAIEALLQFNWRQYSALPNQDAAFAGLRDAVERIGVFVVLIGDLGSHHTAISLESFRGFAIADKVAPFIVINDRDASAAWSFTLLHELTHLLLGQTGISGAESGTAVERFCDEVASTFLLPTELLARLGSLGGIALGEAIGGFARRHNLSASMVAVSLRRAGLITQADLTRLLVTFRDRWLLNRERARSRLQQREGGPSYYVIRNHRLGRALIALVNRATRAGTLTTTKAAQILRVRPKQVHRLLSQSPRPGEWS